MATPRDVHGEAMGDDVLLAAVRTAPTGEALDAAWREALERAELPGEGTADALLLPEALTPFQRGMAEALAARAEGDAWTCRIPGTLRLVRRWLGLTPPSVIDRRIPWTHEGRTVSWPLWRVWSDVPRSSLEHGQGIPRELAETLSPGELIEAAGEAAVYRGITTTWGARGDTVINGFWENLRALEWAPSLRSAQFVVRQWRSCSRYYAKARPKIQAAFDRIIAAHPEVAEALKPQRRKASATSEVTATKRTRAK